MWYITGDRINISLFFNLLSTMISLSFKLSLAEYRVARPKYLQIYLCSAVCPKHLQICPISWLSQSTSTNIPGLWLGLNTSKYVYVRNVANALSNIIWISWILNFSKDNVYKNDEITVKICMPLSGKCKIQIMFIIHWQMTESHLTLFLIIYLLPKPLSWQCAWRLFL